MLERVAQKLASARPQKPAVLIPAFLALGVIVTADFFTSYEYSISPFYVLVILAVSWFCGVWWGATFAFLSVFSQIQIGLLVGHRFSEPLKFYLANGNKLFAYLVIALLAAAVRTLYEKAKTAARIDYLTGITNGLGFYEKTSVEMARHRRNRVPFAVAYIDCDNFKDVNDRLGHSEGDRVLKTVGHTLRSKLREIDIVARLGGDEFALVLPQTSEFSAVHVISKLRPELDRVMAKHHWPVTFSIGIGIFPNVPESVDRVIAFSDKLMYGVKALGGNKVLHRVYSPDEPVTKPPAQLGAVY
jgi:diguanylate cyclase (GGDEF)-like protein